MRVAQWSLKYLVDPDFMEGVLRKWEELVHADVWGHTEVGRFDQVGVRTRTFAPPGWGHLRGDNRVPGADENLIRWRQDAVNYLTGGWRKLSDRTYFHVKALGGKPYPPFHCTWVLLRDKKNGTRHLFLELHAPTRSTPRRMWVWDDVMGGQDGVVAFGHQLRLLYPDASLTVMMDANAAWRKAATRKLLQDHVAKPLGLTFSWAVNTPKTGGGTLISHIASTLPISNPRVWASKSGVLDHDLVTADLDTSGPTDAPPRVTPLPRPGDAKADWRAQGAPVAHPWSGAYTPAWRRRHPRQWRAINVWRTAYLRKLKAAGQ